MRAATGIPVLLERVHTSVVKKLELEKEGINLKKNFSALNLSIYEHLQEIHGSFSQWYSQNCSQVHYSSRVLIKNLMSVLSKSEGSLWP